jgi:SAM-dependent methyltransferase
MTQTARQIDECEVCGNRELVSVLDLGRHPICDDLVKVGDSRVCAEYPIDILFCRTCNTAHQRCQPPKEALFPATYHYRARFTGDVLKGMASLVESCERRFGPLAGKRVVDIGCNDGSLLGFFRERGALTFGIEPTGAAEDARKQGHTVYRDFLSQPVAAQMAQQHGTADFITFTNVFAHIEDLREVLRSVRRLMGSNTVVVIENHYLGSVLDGNQFDTFYHEHPRTYSYTSFVHIARSLDVPLTGVEFPARYGGNIRVYLGGAPREQDDQGPLQERERQFFDRFGQLRANVERWRGRRGTELAALVRTHGPLHAKAFPARAAILIKLLGLTEASIAAVHEKPGSLKIGHYLPGTRIPIVSDDDLFAMPDRSVPVLNLAWHIPNEIRNYLAQAGQTGQVIDIVRSEDFRADA